MFNKLFSFSNKRKLPFEMGPLPPLESNCCILNGKKPEEPIPSTSASIVPAPPASSSSRISNSGIIIDDEDSRSTTKTNSIITTASGTKSKRPKDYITKRKMYFMESCYPRKSPREHASTLAILSSIVNENSRKKSNSGSEMSELLDIDEEASLDRMPAIPEIPLDEDANDCAIIAKLTSEPEIPTFLSPEECLTATALSREIDKFFRYSYRNCDETVALISKKNVVNGLGEKDFLDIISSPCIDEKTIEETFESITTDQINEDILAIKENRILTTAEKLHLARSARKRVRNKTGWPRRIKRKPSKNEPENKSEDCEVSTTTNTIDCDPPESNLPESDPVDRLKDIEEETSNKSTIPVKTNGIITTRRSFKSIFPKSNDMFTVSSDSMDSVPSLDKIDDNESVSTRSLFVSDDSSIDEVLCRSPTATRLSQQNKLNNCIQVNGITSTRCQSRLSNKIKLENCRKREKSIEIEDSGGNTSNLVNGDTTINCHITRRMTNNKIGPIKKRLSQPTHITPPPPQSPKNKKPSTPILSQLSPRKLRKPRGRWYRER